VLGVAIESFWEINIRTRLVFLLLAIVLIFSWLRLRLLKVFGFALLFLLFGLWRYDLAVSNAPQEHIKFYNEQENIIFEGLVVAEPDIRKDQIKYTIKVDNVTKFNKAVEAEGKVLVSTSHYPEYNYGDRLNIKGELLTPGVYNDFSYKDYLAKFQIYSVCYNPEIDIINNQQGNIVYQKILELKKSYQGKIHQVLPEPHASLLSGIILGAKRALPEELREKFNLTGVSHIIVISGFHVAVVAGLLMNFCLGINISRKKSFWISIAGIIFFVVITGLQTSAIRAAIMGGLVLLAMYSGRLNNSRNAILLAAIIMLMINPKLLRYDIGFQLSFLATISIIYLSDSIKKYLKILPQAFKIRESATMTLSAQILTLPIIIYNFERFSLVAPLTNIMVVPLVPLSMLAGSLVGFFGFISTELSQYFSYAAWGLLQYILWVVEKLSILKFAYFEIYNLWWGWIAAYYVIAFYAIFRIRRKNLLKNKI
jgi:competence protein ComEC